ncbi:hypothetical protein A3F60_01675 [Candidatus Roizmanbacteria bacterium RIFCSPHIGHO2_12_FULL_39_8]|uniref:phosphoribosylglycinamide formyltransferase 1 n=1 Tax=Candidatus Roizmanbacteria bacterium RIFCSPHIGHO2_12_FULL_39_8 TaxID=1802050 RepID=A0A1F7HTZ0_9BACT|nr:MAG: hypothetical protein A3F60_01675 [Candidatus Roizmanbacteria bacterium RIFCSPHIGHO2_12_FULL_39_8]
MKKRPLKIAILISGGGTTMESILKAGFYGELKNMIDPALIISSRPNAGGIEKARKLGIAAKNIAIVRFNKNLIASFSQKLLRILKKFDIDLISQNGWLPLTPESIIKEYHGRIINQHPGPLDPGRGYDFGGKYMYGLRVICARLAYAWLTGSDFWTEATTHLVTRSFDEGDLLSTIRLQFEPVPHAMRLSELTQERKKLKELTQIIQQKLLPLEHQNVIITLKKFYQKKINGYRRAKALVPKENYEVLKQAKELAVQLFPDG